MTTPKNGGLTIYSTPSDQEVPPDIQPENLTPEKVLDFVQSGLNNLIDRLQRIQTESKEKERVIETVLDELNALVQNSTIEPIPLTEQQKIALGIPSDINSTFIINSPSTRFTYIIAPIDYGTPTNPQLLPPTSFMLYKCSDLDSDTPHSHGTICVFELSGRNHIVARPISWFITARKTRHRNRLHHFVPFIKNSNCVISYFLMSDYSDNPEKEREEFRLVLEKRQKK